MSKDKLDALKPSFWKSDSPYFALAMESYNLKLPSFLAQDIPQRELRRFVHYVRWRRSDPVIQLPPDAIQESSYSITTGLSIERSQMLAKSLGVQLGATPIGIHATLTKQFQQQFGLKLDITEQEQRTTSLKLANQSGGYRVFALWRIEHLIKVDALAAIPEQPEQPSKRIRCSWLPRASTEFVTGTDPVITYADITPVRPVKGSLDRNC